ncbi:hypothetical protein YPPY94_4389, partial [Yersinia pestis PY-94]
MTTLS